MKRTNARGVVATSLSIAVGTAFGFVLAASPALAQQPVERVEITGSALKRIDAETALPVQIISREEIEKTGAQNVEQFLQAVGVALQGNSNSVVATASGATSGGVSGVSLRGLGSQRTLVLIDGKRTAGGGTITDSTTVDINHIPVAAIERVEVLKDGASAIYGSDAIGGVINFILRKDYKGGEATAFVSIPQQSGAQGGGINALIGWGSLAENRYNVTLVFDIRKEDALFGRQRDFARSGVFRQYRNDTSSSNTFPANIVFPDAAGATGGGAVGNPNAPANCAPGFARTPTSASCRFDPGPYVSLLPKTEQQSFFGNLRFALTKEMEAYGQFSFSHKEQQTVIQPVPISDIFALPSNHPLFNTPPYSTFGGTSAIVLKSSNPNYPTAYVASQGFAGSPDLLVRYRSFITGDRDITNISEQARAVLGVKGTWRAWDYDAGFLHIETTLRERVNGGYPALSKILPILNNDSGTSNVDFFGNNTPPATVAAIKATNFTGDAYKTKSTIDSLSAKVTHDLTQLPGGPLALALGTEGRKEGFKVDPSATIQSGDISGYGGNFLSVDKTRNVGAAFGELVAPVVRTVELTAAARYDHYEGVGDKTSPKLGVRWQPARQVLLRGSIGKGFRAPSLTELYQPQTIGVTAPGLSDPTRCPTTTPSGTDCDTQFPIKLGGNTSLKPEISTNRTLGIVFEPINNASVALDYWEVDLKNTIIFGVTPAAILADPAKFGFLVTRGAPTANCPGCPGPITSIDQTNINFGETKVRGLDIDGRYRIPTAAGAFTIGLNGTYITKYVVQNPDGTFTSINGMVSPITNGNGGVVPRWRHYLYLDWKLAPWNVTFAQQYQSHYRDMPGAQEDPSSPGFTQAHQVVGEYQLFHLYASYTGLMKEQLRLTLGIRNLFNQRPPYSNAGGNNYFQGGYDPGYADPRGRTFLLSATYKFM